MIIVLEGPDGAGKSTLAKTLETQFEGFAKISTVHHGPYPHLKNPSVNYLASLRRKQHNGDKKELVILDRSWLSEPIYGKVLRAGIDRVGVASRRMLERVALKCGALVVRCLPPLKTVQANWAARKGKELIEAPEHLAAVWKGYQTMRTDLPLVEYDFTEGDGGVEFIVDHVYQAMKARPPATGIGQWGPESTLLVGEKVSKHGLPDLPFVSFMDRGCSAWLARHLEDWRVWEDQLYWVNSEELAPDFMGRPDAPTKVVALGRKASSWCEQAGLAYQAVDHPAYWKRFHHNVPYTSLMEILT